MVTTDQYNPNLMVGKKILYVHGFGSSGASGTAKTIQILLPSAEVIAPDLPLHPAEAMDLLHQTCQTEKPDLILLDWMLPNVSGIELCKTIRKNIGLCNLPIIMLTARDAVMDKVSGLDAGADDYITKPFSMDELLMRIHAVYSRYELANEKPSTYQIGSFTFDSPRHTLTKGDKVQKLTSKESDLLLMLCENLGNTLERPVALKAIWDEDTYFNARSMDVYVTKLRKYFAEDPSVQLLNVHGVGFKLVVNETAGN